MDAMTVGAGLVFVLGFSLGLWMIWLQSVLLDRPLSESNLLCAPRQPDLSWRVGPETRVGDARGSNGLRPGPMPSVPPSEPQ